MQAKKSIISLAVVGLMAAATTAFAYGPGFGPQGGGPGMMGPRGMANVDPAQQAAWVQQRLDTLKAALKLQPGQLPAWNAYEAKVKAEAQERAQMRQQMLAQRDDTQAMADQRVAMMKHNAQAAEEINALRKSLYAALNDEQKATFDQYGPGARLARVPAADRGQPGFGPGRGAGRGPGFGRGCIGAA